MTLVGSCEIFNVPTLSSCQNNNQFQTHISSKTQSPNQSQHNLNSGNNDILFTTMGMLIIDEIHYGEMSQKPTVYNIIGGAGTYSALGCRLFCPEKNSAYVNLDSHHQNQIQSSIQQDSIPLPKLRFWPGNSHQIGWIVDVGYDFPDAIKTEIEGWDTGVVWRNTPDRKTTRGWNYYGPHEERGECINLIEFYLLN